MSDVVELWFIPWPECKNAVKKSFTMDRDRAERIIADGEENESGYYEIREQGDGW